MLAAGNFPAHRTICEFRALHLEELSGLFVLPLVGLAGGQFAGFLKAGVAYYAALGAFVLLLDLALVVAARRLFDRERMMSR